MPHNPFHSITETIQQTQSAVDQTWYGPAVSQMRGLLRQYTAAEQAAQATERELEAARAGRPASSGGGGLPFEEDMGAGDSNGGGAIDYPSINQLISQAEYYRERMDTIFGEIVSMPGGAEFAVSYIPERYGQVVEFAESRAGPGGGGGGSVYRPSYSFEFSPNGDLYRMGSDGSFQFVRNIPDFAQRDVQIVTDQRTGEAIALALDNNGNVVSRETLGQFSYPEIDPERIFQQEMLVNAANIEQSFAGLELQRRGQLIDAIGQDLGFQFEMGRIALNESMQRLDTVDRALSQRRAERQDLLRYGVTRESLRTLPSGEVVTQLPFAGQTAALLSQVTGQDFSESDFQLGVSYVNPDQAAQDIRNAGQFQSSIPALTAGLQGARQALSGLFNEPVGDFAASNAIIQQATQGM